MRSAAPKKNTNRIEKVNSLIQHLLGSILLPYFKSGSGLVTITKVETSRDMRWAKVWVSVVGAEDETVMNTLQKNVYDIQGELNREIEVKIVPRISFHLDTSGRHAAHISDIFKQIESEHQQGPPAEEDENE